jgi:hypothetical protein
LLKHNLFRNINHPDVPYDYAQGVLGESAPKPQDNRTEEEDFFGPAAPPAKQPSSHEDEKGLEYAEDEIEVVSDFPVPPDHAAPASDDSTFNRSGADLRIASDTGILFRPSDEELARISEEFKREAMDTAAALSMRPPINPPHSRHPLAQSFIPPSPNPHLHPEPQHLVAPRPVLRTPSPSRAVLGRKRKRVSASEDEEDKGAGSIAGPSTTAVQFNSKVPHQVEAREDDEVSAKRPRLITRQPTWDFEMFVEAGYVPAPPRADPPTRDNSPAPPPQPACVQASPPSIGASLVQKEDSEIEKSQVVEMLSHGVDQGESEDEGEPIGTILAGLGESQRLLPALTADNTQATSTNNTQSEAETPAQSQTPAEALAPVPEDVFGPIVLSVKANKISDTLLAEVSQNDADREIVMSESEKETANVSSKSTRFSLDDRVEKDGHKVFRKTPIRPRTSPRTTEAESLLAAEVEAESQDLLEPLPSPKKKRAIGARVRKPKATASIEPEPTIHPEDRLPSVSASKPPSKLRRGRSRSVQPEVPAPPKTPVGKSTRGRK